MNKTKIDWCDMTWNPVTGCLHGCKYCYARKIANRFGGDFSMARDGSFLVLYQRPNNPYPDKFSPTFHKYRLDEPQKVEKSQKIFVVSMGDLFGDWVPDEWIEKVFEACKKAPQHTYLFLTKNPKRYCESLPFWKKYHDKTLFNNMWFGTTITNKKDMLSNGYELYETSWHTKNTFLSMEPLTEYISDTTLINVKYTKWVIIGAETGNRKDKVIPKREWIESIVEECRSTNVPVFMKNNLKEVWGENLIQEYPESMRGDCE